MQSSLLSTTISVVLLLLITVIIVVIVPVVIIVILVPIVLVIIILRAVHILIFVHISVLVVGIARFFIFALVELVEVDTHLQNLHVVLTLNKCQKKGCNELTYLDALDAAVFAGRVAAHIDIL